MTVKRKVVTDAPKQRIEDMLGDAVFKMTGHRFVREYHPFNDRKWAFDLACPSEKIAVEVSGRYHLHHKQFRGDCERNNWAQAAGWKVLVYPASSVTTHARLPLICEQIHRVLCGVSDVDLDAEILTQPLR